MAFDPQKLNEIRSRIKVSDVVGSRFPLIKKGNEFVVKGNESFTVNDQKQIWTEFGSGGDGKGHDIFGFMQIHEGLSFPEAVEELARQAGLSLKDGPGRPAASTHRNGVTQESDPRDADSGDPGPAASGNDRPQNGVGGAGRNEIVATWDYLDPDNTLLYQTVRMQARMSDGSWKLKDGKIWKTFFQRRPSPDNDGSFVNVLDFLDKEGVPRKFIKNPHNGSWQLETPERRGWWPNAETRQFLSGGNVEHWLYNSNAVIDELQEPKDDQRTIFVPEGEKKVDALKEWSLLAVTNSGGAKHFTKACAEFFRNARHVVILQDNDRAGAEGAAKKAAMLKAVDVELVQVLNFRDVWPACPVKGDVTDWRDAAGGTKDKLLEIVDELKPWVPEPYKSKFGAKTAFDLSAPVRPYPWRIKGIVPLVDNMLLMGPSGSGKTFECLDMLMHCHNNRQFAGHKVVPGGFVYLTYEGATGFENRLRAYLKHHGMHLEDLHSFAWLTRPPNLFASEDNVAAVAEEIAEIAKGFRLPLAATVVDTHNSATRGSSEIKSDDMNKIMANYATVQEKTGAPLWIIGHTNAEGKHRGNEQFFNNIEAAILIERTYTDARHTIERRDDSNVIIRRGRVRKQREGNDSISWDFVLHKVKIGVDEDGDDIDSMVSVEPARHSSESVVHEDSTRPRPEGFHLKGNNVDVFRALLEALKRVGRPPPTQLGLSASVGSVITWAELGIEYKKTDPQEHDEDTAKYRNRIKARTKRFREDLLKYNVIGIAEMIDPNTVNDEVEKPKQIWYVWPTGRRVQGKGLQWPPVAPKKKPDPMLLAPGEREDDLPPF